MTIELYYNESENNQLTKNISLLTTLTGHLRESSNIVTPEILVEAVDLGTANYAHIPIFSRYYYIKEVESFRNGLWRLSLESDVLMSFKSDILELDVILKETEKTGINNYLQDDRVWITSVKDKTDIVSFPNGLFWICGAAC